MATLWTQGVTVKAQDYNVNAYVFDAEVIENSTSITNNTSNVTVNMYAKGINGYSYNASGPTAFINIDGNRKVTENVTYINSTRRLICSWTGDIKHNENGTKSIRVTFNYNSNSGATYLPQSSKITAESITLTTIPRKASITNFTVAKKEETSLTFSFTADAICDYAWYSTNNGTNWTGLDITDDTSATFDVSGLTANTSYNCKIKVRRKDSQLESDASDTITQTTYDYPKVTNVGTANLTIGNEQTLTLYNPLGRTVTIRMNKTNASGTQLYSGTTSTAGQSVTFKFTPTASTLYNSIPNETSAKCVYTAVFSNISTKTITGNYTYKIIGNETPTFSASNWSYTANLTELTNNNQKLINGQSNVTFTINTPASGKNSATIVKYQLKWGNISSDTTSTSGTVSKGNGQVLTATAFDSRGLSTTTEKTISNENFVNYTDIVINNAESNRNNGIETTTKLSLNGTLFNGNFGAVNNTLYSAKYYVSTNQIFSDNGKSIDVSNFTINNNQFSLTDFLIDANYESGGFPIGTSYYVKVEIKDGQGLLSTASFITRVTDGKIARDVFQDSNGDYHTGINGLADSNYAENIHGKLNVIENIYINGVDLLTYIRNNS